MSRGVRGSGGTKEKFFWKWNLKRGVLLWNALDTNIFLLSIFLDFIFIFSDDEEAHDIT